MAHGQIIGYCYYSYSIKIYKFSIFVKYGRLIFIEISYYKNEKAIENKYYKRPKSIIPRFSIGEKYISTDQTFVMVTKHRQCRSIVLQKHGPQSGSQFEYHLDSI